MSAATWEMYDNSLTERAWSAVDSASEALETALTEAEMPERCVQAEQIGFAMRDHLPVVDVIASTDHETDPEPDVAFVGCECGERYAYGSFSEHSEHLADVAAQVYSDERMTEVHGQLDRLRDAIDHLRPAPVWSWAETVREMNR